MRHLRLVWLVGLAVMVSPVVAAGQRIDERNADRVTHPAGAPDLSRVAELIVEQTNQFRKQQGREPVETNETLTQTATEFAQFMARTDKYGHEADGRQPSERATAHGYKYCIIAENIAWQFSSVGFTTQELAERFVAAWKESPGHRRNMLDPDVIETGVAVAHSRNSDRYYAVQMFGRPKSREIAFRVRNDSEVTVKYKVGEQTFPLPPRYSRTHQRCRPTQVEFLKPDSQEIQKRFAADNGDTFILRPGQPTGYTVAEEPAPEPSK